MPKITVRQRELANEPMPIVTIVEMLTRAGFNLNDRIERQDDFFNDQVTFFQNDNNTACPIREEICNS